VNGDDSKSTLKASKKRKRDNDVDAEAEAEAEAHVSSLPLRATTEVPEKTLKRLRKNLSKLDASVSTSASVPLPLATFLEQLGQGKSGKVKGERTGEKSEKTEKTVETDEVLRGLKVEQVDGKWVITV
jgi:hypothetical protein